MTAQFYLHHDDNEEERVFCMLFNVTAMKRST